MAVIFMLHNKSRWRAARCRRPLSRQSNYHMGVYLGDNGLLIAGLRGIVAGWLGARVTANLVRVIDLLHLNSR